MQFDIQLANITKQAEELSEEKQLLQVHFYGDKSGNNLTNASLTCSMLHVHIWVCKHCSCLVFDLVFLAVGTR